MENQFNIWDRVILTHEYGYDEFSIPVGCEMTIKDGMLFQFNKNRSPKWYYKVNEFPAIRIPEEWLQIAPVTWEPTVAWEPIESDFDTDQHNEQDPVEQLVHPSYYQDGIEPIDYIQSHGLSFNLGNVVKYVTRAGKKTQDALPDLQKALYYLQYEIRKAEGHRHE